MKSKSLKRFLCAILTFVMICTLTTSAYAEVEEEITIPSDTRSASTYSNAYGVGQHYLGQFSFYDYNIGRCRTINGNRMRVRIAFKQIDGIDDYADMHFYLNRYDGLTVQYQNLCRFQDEPDEYGYRYYVLPWVNVSYGVDYYMHYIAYTCCFADKRKVDCYVWIDVE